MNNQQITEVAQEAARLLFDNPSWTYKKAIEMAKEVMQDGIKSNDRTN